MLEEVQKKLLELLEGEPKENIIQAIKGNKHNNSTTTYYLLLKKIEKETGKNVFYERVTREKRNYHSMSNLNNAQTRVSSLHNNTFYKNASSNSQIDYQNVMNQTSMDGFAKANTTKEAKSEQKARNVKVQGIYSQLAN
mmetsp:Transcript_33921/g.24963  ORF Transcript_33921/g.24963 Transcript_33921/m.24963 type:complete len:139 (+) Transcript_33921:1070-1486(+)